MARFDSTFTPYHPFGSRPLRLEASGTDVAILQAGYNTLVNTLALPDDSLGVVITITGEFDAATKAAIENLQRYFGLAVDGEVGSSTYFAFGHGVGAEETYGGPAYGSRPLSLGMSGGDVTVLQSRLSCFKYADMLEAPATGLYDESTAQAVNAFKHSAHLNGDTGFFHEEAVDFGFYNASWLYTFAGGRPLFCGRKGLDVVFIQSLLTGLGHYSSRLTGYYDSETAAAVEAFQAAEGLVIDGVAGPATYYQLGLKNPNPPPHPLPLAWPTTTISLSSVGLNPIASAVLRSVGVASLTANSSQPRQWLNVVGDNLPSPDQFGSPYTTYAFTLADPASGSVSKPQVMFVVPSGHGTWAGTLEDVNDGFPLGLIHIYPSNPTGSLLGSAVLEGNLLNPG